MITDTLNDLIKPQKLWKLREDTAAYAQGKYVLIAIQDDEYLDYFRELLPNPEEEEDMKEGMVIIPLSESSVAEACKDADDILDEAEEARSREFDDYAEEDAGIDLSIWPDDWQYYFDTESSYIVAQVTAEGYAPKCISYCESYRVSCEHSAWKIWE